MSALQLVAPDGSACPVETQPTKDGVALIVPFVLEGEALTLRLELTRPAARLLARSLNADAGDGIERSFPRPAIEEA